MSQPFSASVTKEQVAAHLKVVQAVAEAIREAGSLPSGPLYAIMCGVVSLESFNHIIDTLKRTGLVVEENHLLIWKGDAK